MGHQRTYRWGPMLKLRDGLFLLSRHLIESITKLPYFLCNRM